MRRLHYSAIQDRFGHIDASFVRAGVAFPDRTAVFSVSMYPWWEHPLYLRARDEQLPWGFGDCKAGAREVTVHAEGVVVASLSSHGVGSSISDWYFTTKGPELWRFEPDGQVFVNERVDLGELAVAVASRLDERAPDVAAWLSPPSSTPPYSLRAPRTVLEATVAVLAARGVAHLVASRPAAGDHGLVAFVVDERNQIVAENFHLDVPDWEHRPEWFAPR